MTLPDTLTRRLRAIAEREGRTPESLLQALLDAYERRTANIDPVDEFIGAFDDDVTDLSATVRLVPPEERIRRLDEAAKAIRAGFTDAEWAEAERAMNAEYIEPWNESEWTE